jgi:hypothetical protein
MSPARIRLSVLLFDAILLAEESRIESRIALREN